MARRNGKIYGVPRPYATRPALPVVTIVCDDTKTALAYFTELKRCCKASVTVMVEPAPRSGATPAEVLSVAVELAGALEPGETGDSTWVLLDTEADAQRQAQARDAKENGEREGITVLISKPCYEVWTLAHFVSSGEAFENCAEVVARVKAEWRSKLGASFGNKKAQADYSKLMPLIPTAIQNAKRRNPSRDGSYTEVYKAAEAILRFCAGTANGGPKPETTSEA